MLSIYDPVIREKDSLSVGSELGGAFLSICLGDIGSFIILAKEERNGQTGLATTPFGCKGRGLFHPTSL